LGVLAGRLIRKLTEAKAVLSRGRSPKAEPDA
jgi:hypothetical protein